MTSADAARVATIACSGLVGLAIGSFLNVVAFRLPRAMSVVHPGSHCPACRTPLGPLETVPVVSWLVLRGKCRHCRAPISARYTVVELATGLAFAAVATSAGSIDAVPPIGLIVACAIAAAVIDAEGSTVPTTIVLVGAAGALSLVAVAGVQGDPARIGWAALGGGAAYLGAWLAFASRRPLRWRGAMMVAAVGWAAGWAWPAGGALVAAWIAVAAASQLTTTTGRLPLAMLVGGAFAVAVAGLALGT